MAVDDLEEAWADILPPRQPRPEPVPAEILPGQVWMGLLAGDVEPVAPWYVRQSARVPDGDVMEFKARFVPQERTAVSGLALFSSRTAGDMLWRVAIQPIYIPADMTFEPTFVLRDTVGSGWREMLKTKGVL